MLIEGRVGIGTTIPTGILDISSTNSALVLPRNGNPVNNVGAPALGMIIYDSTNKTLRYYDGIQWNTVLSSQTITPANEGVVKMNSGSGIKPSYSFKTSSGVPLNTYQTPINIATVSNIYNSGKFLENPIPGQVHTWRIIAKYSNKNNGSVGYITMNLSNPLSPSTFSIDQTAIAPNGVTTGNLVFYLISIADSLSINNGYELKIKSDTSMDITIDSITRISQAKD